MPDGLQPLFSSEPKRDLPMNLSAEQALLGAILANNKAADLCSFLRPEHFADLVHGRIFAECRRLIEAGRVADAVTLKGVLEHDGVLDEVGGTAYLAQLMTAMVGINMAGDYARVVRDTWLRRQVIEAGTEAADAAYASDDGDAVIAEAVDRLMSLGEQSVSTAAATVGDALDKAMGAAEAAYRGEGVGGLLTGIPSLDELWGGLWPSCLDCLGARSMHGKTALGVQAATHIARTLLTEHKEAVEAGDKRHALEHVAIFSLEMPRDHLALRMLATETQIPVRDIRAGKIGGNRAEALIAARAQLRELPLLIHDTPSMSVTDIAMAARSAVRRKRAKLIVIDHLHRVRPAAAYAKAPRNEQVQSITEALKTLASSLEIPVLLLAQLSRQSERREDHRPVVADLEYAGERDFDNLLLLWRPELYMGEQPPQPSAKTSDDKAREMAADWWRRKNETRGRAEVILAKGRMGEPGAVWLEFDGPRTLFSPSDYRPNGDCQ